MKNRPEDVSEQGYQQVHPVFTRICFSVIKGDIKYKVEIPPHIRAMFVLLQKLSSNPVFLIGSSARKLITGETTFTDYDFVGKYDFSQAQNYFGTENATFFPEADVLKLKMDQTEIDMANENNIDEALDCRDITISRLAISEDGYIYDPNNFINDLVNNLIRVDSETKIEEDPVRIIRVIRMAVELGWGIDLDTIEYCKKYASKMILDHKWVPEQFTKVSRLSQREKANFLTKLQELDLLEEFSNVAQKVICIALENSIGIQVAINNLSPITNAGIKLYFFGGCIRDIVWDISPKDFDIKVNTEIDNIIQILESVGYTRSENYAIQNGEYFYNPRFDVVSFKNNDMIYDITQVLNISEGQIIRILVRIVCCGAQLKIY